MKNKISKKTIIIFVLFCFLTISSNGANEQLNVIATTGFLYDALLNIGQDKINVHNLLGPGIDPHTYRPTENDVVYFANADIIFWNGNHLESYISKYMRVMENAFEVAQFLPKEIFLDWEQDGDNTFKYDPHFWNDPYIWMRVIYKCSEALADYDKANADFYKKNALKYIEEIKKAHSYLKEKAKLIPEPKVVITTHDAFTYFGNRYNLKMLGVQGISTDSEASVSDLQDITDIMAKYNVSVVFGETTVNKDNLTALQEAAKSKGVKNARIAIKELYSDALSEEGGPADTYVKYLKYNMDLILSELQR